MPDATLATVRAYELIAAFLFVAGLIYVWRARNPIYAGAYLGTSIGGAIYEWVFDSKYYFRLTIDDRFIPAWTMAGVKAPLAMILFYAFFFGIPLMILLNRHDQLVGRFGPRGLYVFLGLLGVIGTPLFECLNTSITEIYKYNQAEQYLLWGMPWSNLWFGALMFMLPYWGLRKAEGLVALSRKAALLDNRSVNGLGVILGFSAIITGFFVAASLNGIWYVVADPWIPTTRPF